MTRSHFHPKDPFFVGMILAAASCLFIPAAGRGEEKPGAERKLQTLDEIVQTLPRFDVSGEVVNKAGKPVAKADIWLYYACGYNGLRDRLVGHIKTTKQGTFVFKKAMVWEPPTTPTERHTPHYVVIASHPVQGIYFQKLFKDDPTDKVRIALKRNTFGKEKTQTRTITVTDEEGKPLAGVKVYLSGGILLKLDQPAVDRKYHYMRVNQDLGIASGVTDDQGTVTLGTLLQAYYWAEKEGYVRTWIPGQKAVMFKGAEVSGTVSYPDGTPAPGAAVTYNYHGNRLVWDEVTIADANGQYTFESVPASGFYYSWMNPADETGAQGNGGVVALDLRLNSPLLSRKQTFTIRPGDKLRKDIAFLEGVRLAGTVIDLTTGKPAPMMQLRMLIETGQRYLDSKAVATDENGHFETSVAPGSNVRFSWESSRTDGSYLIDEQWRRQLNNYEPPFRKTVTDNEEDIVFKVKLVPINPLKGRVVDPNGNAVASAGVYVHSQVPSAKADQSGVFELKAAFAERDFDLYAESPDGSLAGLAHFKAGTASATIPLSPTRTYSGEVKNTDGLPAGNLKFYMDLKINDDTNYHVRREPTTDAEGRFTAANLCPAATYHLWWHSDNDENRDYDYGSADVDLTTVASDEPIRFEAKQYLNALMGKVVDDQGKPIAKATLRPEIFGQRVMAQGDWQKQYSTDEKGEFEIPRLAPGEVDLIITATGFLTRRVRAKTDSFDFEAVLRPDTGKRSYGVKVVDDSDKPLANIPLRLKMMQRQKDEMQYHDETQNAQTDAEGAARFDLELDMKNRFYARGIIECDVEDYDLAYARLDPREESDLVLKLHTSGQHWEAQVLAIETGEPIAGAVARVRGMRTEGGGYAYFDQEPGMEFRADEQGLIRFVRFSTKDHISVDVSAPGYAKEQKWLPSEDLSDAVFKLARGGSIAGKIKRTDAGELPEGLRVSLAAASGRGMRENLPVEKDGSFSWDQCVPGSYTLTVVAPTPEGRKLVCPSKYEVEVKKGQTTDVVIEMEEGTLVCGTMIDAVTGKAPGEKNFAYVTAAGGQAYAPVDEQGRWELYLTEGEHKLAYLLRDTNRSQEFKTVTVKKGRPVKDLVITLNADGTPKAQAEAGSTYSTPSSSSSPQ